MIEVAEYEVLATLIGDNHVFANGQTTLSATFEIK